MGKLLIFTLLIFTAISCKNSESGDIIYKDTYNVQLVGLNKKTGAIKIVVGFTNQFEKTDFKLKEMDVDISIGGIDMGTYFSKNTLTIKALSELKVPIEYGINNEKLQDNNGEYSSTFVVQLNGTAIFVNEQGEEQEVKFSHKESVNHFASKKEKRRKDKGEGDEEQLSRSEKRKNKKIQRKLIHHQEEN
ncbi:MAG: hypothetical protein LC105_09160 [Chitinophagales bacterium]|nr:hypothetical protein [Chitinophagales bacterium]